MASSFSWGKAEAGKGTKEGKMRVNTRKLRLALVLALGVVLLLAGMARAAPTEVWVDDGWAGCTPGDPVDGHTCDVDAFGTIQEGIDAVDASGTVHVYDGIYNENVVINTSLTLEAASSPIIDGGGALGPAVHITADDVTFQGFIIRDFTCTPAAGIGAIWVEGGDGAKIDSNIVYDITSQVADPAGIGIDVHASNVEVTNNEIYDVDSIGIRVRHDWDTPPTVSNNILLENNTVYHTGNSGVLVTGYAKGVTIRNNEIYESLEPTPYNLFVHYGASDITIGGEGNHIHDAYANIVLAGCDNVTIKDNTIEGATPLPSNPSVKGKNIYILSDYGPWYDLDALSTNVEIVGNDILNADGWGVRILNAYAADPSAMAATTTINFNNIVGNTEYGVENGIATDVDAENNWWGANDGPSTSPGSGDKISTNVDADPWLEINISANPASIPANGTSTSTITADMTENSDGYDTSVLGHIPDGTSIEFETTKGSIGSPAITKPTTDGEAQATLTSSTTPETATLTASAPPHTAPATITTTVEFIAGLPYTVTLTANPTTIVANGVTTSTLTATVKDASANAVADGTIVYFSTDLGILAALSRDMVVKTTTDGVATAVLTSTKRAGVATAEAASDGFSDSAEVTMLPRPPKRKKPGRGAVLPVGPVRFVWRARGGAAQYHLKVWRKGESWELVINKVLARRRFRKRLAAGRYKWKVRAGLGGGVWGPWPTERPRWWRFRVR